MKHGCRSHLPGLRRQGGAERELDTVGSAGRTLALAFCRHEAANKSGNLQGRGGVGPRVPWNSSSVVGQEFA